ncbi:MAG: LamG domain-containing protein [Acidobacteriota bacterium]
MNKLRGTIFLVIAFLALAAVGSPAVAQPFGAWLVLSGPTNGYVEIAHNAALNPASAITIEGWVAVTDPGGGCSSIIGKNWQHSWWVGICGTTLRSYLAGSTSQWNGGKLSGWTHFAVVYDGAHRYHYINGELINSTPQTGSLPPSTDPVRIGSDVLWNYTPGGSINEIRLWNVARTQDQIRQSINVPITTAQPGLVAVWRDGMHDALGHYTGTTHGSTGFLTFPATHDCGSSTSSALCLLSRWFVSMTYRIGAPGTAEANATTVPYYNPGSGLFYFNNPNDWQILVKVLDGCAINGHIWVGTAASTNLFYRLTVSDAMGSAQKIYFNYPGPIAPSVLDTSAFASCP